MRTLTKSMMPSPAASILTLSVSFTPQLVRLHRGAPPGAFVAPNYMTVSPASGIMHRAETYIHVAVWMTCVVMQTLCSSYRLAAAVS